MNPKIYHLQMIQGVISRQAGNSFLIKGWSVTVMAAMIALLARGAEKRYILFVIIPVIFFWTLDSMYLSNERRFKALYDQVRLLPEDKIDFSMDTKPFKKWKNYFATFFSTTLCIFYLASLLTVAIIYFWL
jgi:hypothetical protein